MLWLTRETGQDVTIDGVMVGTVDDLTVRLGTTEHHFVVDHLLIATGHHRYAAVGWDRVRSFDHDRVTLRSGSPIVEVERRDLDTVLAADELLLRRDVLDTQIIDTADQRLSRVADVVLERRDDQRLELLAVETGFGRVVERIGLHRIARRFPEHAVAWDDLHLTSDRGHSVQLATPRSAVNQLDAAGLAHLVDSLGVGPAVEVLHAVGAERAADAILEIHPDSGERVLRAMSPSRVDSVIEQMPAPHRQAWRQRLAHHAPINRRRFHRSRRMRKRRRT